MRLALHLRWCWCRRHTRQARRGVGNRRAVAVVAREAQWKQRWRRL